jgi:DNA-binding NarL/FixJ family response regulator
MHDTRDTRASDASIGAPLRRPDDLPASIARPRVVIVSDVCLYREGLALALHARGDVQIVSMVDSREAAERTLVAHPCDVVLLDAGMPHALPMARTLLGAHASIKVIAVAVADEAADVVACAQAGLDGYVPRDGSIDDVAAAIHGVILGELRCSPRMTSALFKRLAALGPVADEPTLLTPRELEVVELIDRGLSNKEIARRLRIGTATVKNHVHNILDKLHVTRRAEAAAQLRARASTSPTRPARNDRRDPEVRSP